MSRTNTTDIVALLADLEAGVFAERLAAAVTDTALGVVTNGKKGKVVITLELARVANASQVTCSHRIQYKRPTTHGNASEDATTSTPLYVGTGGKLSLFPETQPALPGFAPHDATHTA